MSFWLPLFCYIFIILKLEKQKWKKKIVFFYLFAPNQEVSLNIGIQSFFSIKGLKIERFYILLLWVFLDQMTKL